MPLVRQAFFDRDALDVARDSIGMELRRGGVRVRITEVEAYRWPRDGAAWRDSANHCSAGRTAHNRPMWGPPGRAYVYLCYGLHHMLNLVTGRELEGAAVLIRAGEPIAGIRTIRHRRGNLTGPALLTGPGKVGAALGLDLTWNDHPLFERGGLELHTGTGATALMTGPRIGIAYAAPRDVVAPWRIADADSAWVSHRRKLEANQG